MPPSFGTGWWFKPVPILTHWNRLEPPPGANCPPLGWSKAKGTSFICNSSWYLWPGPMTRFLVVFCDKIREKIVLHIERSCCFKLKIFNPTTIFPIAVFSIFLPISPLASASRSHTAATQHLHLKPLHHSPPLLEATVQGLPPSEAVMP